MTDEIPRSLSPVLESNVPHRSQPVHKSPRGEEPTAVVAAAPTEKPDKSAYPDAGQSSQVEKAAAEDLIGDMQKLMQIVNRQLSFKVDEDTGRTVISVIDRETDELVRQIPAEAIVELQKRLAEIQDSGSSANISEIDGVLFSSRV